MSGKWEHFKILKADAGHNDRVALPSSLLNLVISRFTHPLAFRFILNERNKVYEQEKSNVCS